MLANMHIGCPAWGMTSWRGGLFPAKARSPEFLNHYASVFNAVEGNSTFYALPKAEIVARWGASVGPSFRFCFKFPSAITHELRLRHAERATHTFLTRMAPLGDNLGPLMLQLPPSFGSDGLPTLERFVRGLPSEFDYAVELRHPQLFGDPERERPWIERLRQLGVDVITMDTRPLFSAATPDDHTADVQRRKPRLPVRGRCSGRQPIVRFVGHPQLDRCDSFIRPWVEQLSRWLQRGHTPYFFAHMPDDRDAPPLARRIHTALADAGLDVGEMPAWPGEQPAQRDQASLF